MFRMNHDPDPSKFTYNNVFKPFSDIYEKSADSMSIPSTPSTPCSPLADLFDIEVITEKDRDDVLQFLQTFFFKDEPLNSAIGLITDENPRCLDLETYSLKELNNGLNLKAVMDGKLIGVCLNGMLHRGFVDDIDINEKVDDPKFTKIVRLLNFVAKDSDVFQHFPDCDKAMYVKILSVDTSLRGKGIAKDFLARTRDMARENGCGFMTVDCSSHFTAMALKKLNFNKVYSMDYADYKVDGEVVFNPASPHKAITVYTQRIQ
ncbi:arylalkylamine N-acetyltransferase 1-like isoform X2 [Aethina tumida]|uniref:arylalkylamine N-acetyltransferase 1-like isoform X2 n=1 Tax=Aethina tumida TaxID=116153 RepID=UPI002148AE40|nr:arylalkylamine N-acetyltransferase 1-like isoform X2 [Aethina tumida]